MQVVVRKVQQRKVANVRQRRLCCRHLLVTVRHLLEITAYSTCSLCVSSPESTNVLATSKKKKRRLLGMPKKETKTSCYRASDTPPAYS